MIKSSNEEIQNHYDFIVVGAGAANEWRGAGGPIHIRRPKDPHPTAPAFIEDNPKDIEVDEAR